MLTRTPTIRGNAPAIAIAIATLCAALGLVSSATVNRTIALVAALLAAVLLARRAHLANDPTRAIWLLLTAHVGLIAVGNVLDTMLRIVAGEDPVGATLADPVNLLAYVPLVVAIVRLASLNSSVRLSDLLIDALAVALVAGLGLWQIIAGQGSLAAGGGLDRLTAGAYPAADVLVVGALAALVFARTPASRMVGYLGLYGVLTLARDTLGLATTLVGAPAILATIAATSVVITYGLLGAAALSRESIGPPAVPPVNSTGSVPRLTLLGIAVICAPALAVILSIGHRRAWAPLLVLAAVAVSLLVMIRVAGLVRRLEVEQRRLSAAEAHLAYQASHDALTGLPNRSLLTDRLGEEVRRAEREGREIALMFIDLDDFKLVNDTLGHAAGDALLRVIAHRIQDEISPGDIVGRVGGDEFVVVSPNLMDRRSANRFADSLLASVSAAVAIDRHLIEPSVSIGIALRGASADPQVLLANADLALYKAKNSGRSCARIFDHSLRQAADERQGIETGLRRAVSQREIAVEYQPQIDLATGKVASLEALARWPSRPDVAVSRFIEVAEDTGIVDQLGRQVLHRACEDIVKLNDRVAGDPVGVSVNVSMRQLMQRDLADLVAHALRRHRVPHHLLTLEITETFVAHEPEIAARTLAEIQGLGVWIEVDDFGVGHTSFRSLSHLPIDGIKIDRSLVHGLGEDGTTESIVTAILAMAQALGLKTTVEGIETADELHVIRMLGADLGQGYLFSRPVPYETAERLVATWPGLCPAAAELVTATSARPSQGNRRSW